MDEMEWQPEQRRLKEEEGNIERRSDEQRRE